MVIKLYNNKNDKNHVDKKLSNELTLNGHVRESIDIIQPIITVESSNLITSNYCYVPDFNRYYYITKITSVSKNIYDIELDVDVLMSYKDVIRQQTAVIARQEKLYNLYLPDDSFKTYNKPQVITKNFPMSFPAENSLILLVASPSSIVSSTSEEG